MTRSPDPIFAAIAAHWSAYQALPDLGRSPASPEEWQPYDDECEAFQTLASTSPTTLEGVRALVTHLRRFLAAEEVQPGGEPPEHDGMRHAHALEAALSLALPRNALALAA